MQVSKAVHYWLEYVLCKYQRQYIIGWSIIGTIPKKNTIKSYEFIGSKFIEHFNGRDLNSLTTEDALSFLNSITEGTRQYTKRGRYSYLTSFFNFIKNNLDESSNNPCDTPMMRKLFRATKPTNWKIIEKDVIDEIIFRTTRVRNRLILELMSRGGMRISEVLNLTARDVNERKLLLREPKSGRNRKSSTFRRR